MKLRASSRSIYNWSLQRIYWILIAIVVVAVTTSIALHFSISGNEPSNFIRIAYGQESNTTIEGQADNITSAATITISSYYPWTAYILANGTFDAELNLLTSVVQVMKVKVRPFIIDCSEGYFVVAQKKGETGWLAVRVSQGDTILDKGYTYAPYGLVNLARTC